MPRIAQSIADQASTTPISFYWHLGDFRGIDRVDCDYAKHDKPEFQCVPGSTSPNQKKEQKSAYLKNAWNNFIEYQLDPFNKNKIPVFLGIGNHELKENFTRASFKERFADWLKQDAIEVQRKKDSKTISSTSGDTFYHFVQNGVDFIYLDNAEEHAFLQEEIVWLYKVLDADAEDDTIKTIIVAMHQALPGSTSKNHAMDDGACQDICKANEVYERLYQAQHLSGPPAKRKNVYLFASHAHLFDKNIYQNKQPHVLPGWLVGTAGAEQHRDQITYGYVQVEVLTDGTINAKFIEVNKNSPSANKQPEGSELIKYCFSENKISPPKSSKSCPKC